MKFKIPDTPEELFRQGGERFASMKKWLVPFMILFFIFMTLGTSFYTVKADEVGVIRRFGKFVRLEEPGLHWKIPFNVERLDRVKIAKVFKEEFGFRTIQAGINTRYSTQNFEDESIMLTGDLNVIEVTWIVQFKIKDPIKLLFNIRTPQETIRDISESVMRQVIGDSTVTEALTTRRIAINLEVRDKFQKILDGYESGIEIELVELQDVNPPDAVKASFNEENVAKQEKEKVINQAREARNKVIPRARGEAAKTISESEGYAKARVEKAKGDASKFIQTWDAYKDAKDVTRRRLYLETLEEVLPRAGRVFITEPTTNNILPLLNLTQSEVK